MTKKELKERVKGLNEYMLAESNKKLQIIEKASCYTYNKALAITDKEVTNIGWYGIDNKYCCKTWAEIEAYLDGICKGISTDFMTKEEER